MKFGQFKLNPVSICGQIVALFQIFDYISKNKSPKVLGTGEHFLPRYQESTAERISVSLTRADTNLSTTSTRVANPAGFHPDPTFEKKKPDPDSEFEKKNWIRNARKNLIWSRILPFLTKSPLSFFFDIKSNN